MTSAAPLDVGRLRLLREVGLRGTIAGAARELGLTPSAVSQQLAVLEREAGTVAGRPLAARRLAHRCRARAGRARRRGARRAVARRVPTSTGIAGAVGGPVGDRRRGERGARRSCRRAVDDAARTTHPGIAVCGRRWPSRPRAWRCCWPATSSSPSSTSTTTCRSRCPTSSWRASCAPSRSSSSRRAAGTVRAGRRWPSSPTQPWVMPPDDAACGLAVRSACRAAGFEPRRAVDQRRHARARRARSPPGTGSRCCRGCSVADDAAPVERP